LLFVIRPGVLRKQLDVFEMHYLEQTTPAITSSWSNIAKKDGILILNDLRTHDTLWFYNERRFWNVDEREGFMKNVTTYWRGLRHKDLNKGVRIDNSVTMTPEDILLVKKTNEDVKKAIEKYGPLNITDYDLNYRYQLKKRVLDQKKELLTQIHVSH
jgi:hypothetical protein